MLINYAAIQHVGDAGFRETACKGFGGLRVRRIADSADCGFTVARMPDTVEDFSIRTFHGWQRSVHGRGNRKSGPTDETCTATNDIDDRHRWRGHGRSLHAKRVADPHTKVSVRPLANRADRESFLDLPWSLYKGDPSWVPPLKLQLRERLSPESNPYFEHAQMVAFLAERDGEVVGRITAQVCQLAQEFHGRGTGHFGFFECENNLTTAASLLNAAERWLRDRAMTRMLGPFDLSVNDELGMLVDGFEYPPYVMMGHHHPYYGSLMSELGLEKAMDLHAYMLDISKPYTARIGRIVERVSRDDRIVLRPLNQKNYRSELRQVLEVFKDSWSDNWGYVPPTDAEADHLINEMRPLISRGSVMLCQYEGELAGFMIVLPNLNEFIGDLNGSLFPTGWIRLLWRLRFAPVSFGASSLMGILRKHQNTRLGASIALSMIDQCRSKFVPQGVTDCEMSWILESNAPMRSILDAAGCEPYKRYRIFSKTL